MVETFFFLFLFLRLFSLVHILELICFVSLQLVLYRPTRRGNIQLVLKFYLLNAHCDIWFVFLGHNNWVGGGVSLIVDKSDAISLFQFIVVPSANEDCIQGRSNNYNCP